MEDKEASGNQFFAYNNHVLCFSMKILFLHKSLQINQNLFLMCIDVMFVSKILRESSTSLTPFLVWQPSQVIRNRGVWRGPLMSSKGSLLVNASYDPESKISPWTTYEFSYVQVILNTIGIKGTTKCVHFEVAGRCLWSRGRIKY